MIQALERKRLDFFFLYLPYLTASCLLLQKHVEHRHFGCKASLNLISVLTLSSIMIFKEKAILRIIKGTVGKYYQDSDTQISLKLSFRLAVKKHLSYLDL